MPSQKLDQSQELSERARKAIPGGINSYARKFDRELNWDSGSGSRITDVDGNEYVDYLQAWGAIILGHCDEEINAAVTEAESQHDLYGYGTTELEVDVAERIQHHVPSAEKVLFGVTGSEVTAHATRLARGVTDRRKIIKFQGHYHGWYDSLAMNHLTEPEKLGTNDPDTAGLLDEIVDETIVLPFNDEDAIRETFAEHGDEIAGVILEPIAHNMGCIPPRPGYLETLREVTDDYGSLLIFDEIITGFRHDLGGAQKLEGVTPDLTTMGKSVANGYPISILCGKEEYMNQLSPAGGPVAFGGTYNAHAGSLAAARETMTELDERNFHEEAKAYRDRICDALEDILEDNGITATVEKYGTVFLTYFMEDTPHEYTDVLEQNEELYMDYRWGMVDEGIMMVPKNVRRNYITAAHDDEDARRTIEAAQDVLSELSQ
ncbi:aspartate aminotransferase family protein [Halovenus marina]|uniref:aspartate aminotransferase family protein n=1 Tax=Halovenus marina TaxID=3396621 RepID=UPI003F54CF2B